MRILNIILALLYAPALISQTLNNHQVRLDDQQKILPRISYDTFLHQRWNFIKHKVPSAPGPAPRSNYPQYFFYCAFIPKDGELVPDQWMNDVGEKIPNWFESARHYYAYTGDDTVMAIVKRLADYSLDHGISPANFAWPNMPYTTTNAGDTIFRGFTSAKRFLEHEIQVDHAGEIGLTYFRLYQYTNDKKYLGAAIKVANTLAAKVRTGTATHSPWPYRVVMSTGKAIAEYGANWFGCYELLDLLQKNNFGNPAKYRSALAKVKDFVVNFPVKTGYWTDGHTDTDVNSHTYRSNMSASNAKLFMFDRPDFNKNWKSDIPGMIKWTEKYFIERGAPGEPGNQWGANIVGEQDSYLYKMDYQTARYAAECARWYGITGDESFKDKAFRSLNWVTYCNDDEGMATESPLSKGINSWWSDCYGEGPRMFYHVFAAIPEWAPSNKDHILYSTGVLKNVYYKKNKVEYEASDAVGKEYIKLTFTPANITVNGAPATFKSKTLNDGTVSIIVERTKRGKVKISAAGADEVAVKINTSKRFQKIDGIGVNANTRSWSGNELKPALDLLIDSMHAPLWRVIVETVEKWEDKNDNNDPFVFNWEYYNKLYETPKFQKAWNTIAYLNSRGITDKLMINFMGPVPAWMGKKTVLPQHEDEYVEMLASFFWYAKNKKNLTIGLISPTNESDWRNEGPELDEVHYSSVMKKLMIRMDSLGMGNIKYVGPDPADMKKGISKYVPEMMKDSLIMSKLAHIGLHSYGGYYANVDSAIKHSKYPQSTYWITEWNAWRDGLDDGKIGVYDYTFASQSVGYLIELLRNGASGFMEWEGFDSYYEHHYPSLFSYWGILGYNPSTKTYSPRKHFYTIKQVSKYVTPGSTRISMEGPADLNAVAFVDSSNTRMIITGINENGAFPFKGTVDMPVENISITYTDSARNLQTTDITQTADGFSTTIPAQSIFTITADLKKIRPQPSNWYSGDIHVHRNCGNDSVLNEDQLTKMMDPNDLDIISVLADMGNGEVKYADQDLKKITGTDAPQSKPGRIVHWDAEWHWDATYSNFSHQALGGHLVLLGLKNSQQIWEESPYKILEWAKKQNAARGFCHFQYLNDSIQNELNCCIPVDYPVEAALGNIDFISEDVYGYKSPGEGTFSSESAMSAYYKLLNCGFKLGLAAGTDYPCNSFEPLGKLLTYVKVDDELTYQKWVDGIKNGRTVVSRNGNKEFIDLKVGTNGTGDEIALHAGEQLDVEVQWTSAVTTPGTIELVCNGEVIAQHTDYAKPGVPIVFKTKRTFIKSSWIIARRMYKGEHLSHTAPVYIKIDNKPIRANADDAMYFVKWIDNILKNIGEGGPWNKYFTKDLDSVKQHYTKAKQIYQHIANESTVDRTSTVMILAEKGNYIEEILRAEGLNSFESSTIINASIPYEVVIVPKATLSDSQVQNLQQYVQQGGRVIAFHPNAELAERFGLKLSDNVIRNGYLSINTSNKIGKGLAAASLQTHGSAQGFSGKKLTTIATLNNNLPAVVSIRSGKGQIIAFAYDLPANVMLTRQGNPKSAGIEKDGIRGLRAMDLFTDGWVDTSKNRLNQADEQMRLLTRCIRSLANKPLPSLWYFPDSLKTLVTLTNDGEYSDEKDIEPQFADIEAKNANMSLYILTASKISKAITDAWQKRGNEISGHPDNTQNAEHPTWQNMNAAIDFKINEIADKYAIQSMRTIVNHWFVWCGNNAKGEQDFTAQARIERLYGIGMDINYAHYDNNSSQQRFLGPLGEQQGNYAGTGLPMKFGDMNGKTLDIYQHHNNVYDQQYMENKDSLGFFNAFKGIMDRSINNEVYSYISVKCHNDEYFFSKVPLSKMLDYAAARNIPVWAPQKLLDFLIAKDNAKFNNIKWAGNKLSFTIASDFTAFQ